MRTKRNRRPRRPETPSPESEVERTQVETPKTGNTILTNVISESQRNIGQSNAQSQLNEPNLISNEIQVCRQILEEKKTT